ncbi:3-deoxy-D-manno-octulosonic acid transferase [Sulfuriferula thiophila]|uniref:3-deoxy-D-manno-octulosonic acid transferase n=1 Tax=Sulfuriferula thiophila TaxID=1781211 RepID=UPI000F60B343|nr:3-deoxy-D-manno-octulosonic acid transferase [Sulfuriferula thiophila]
MGLFDFLGFNKLPAGVTNSSLLITDTATLARAGAFIEALQAKFHNIAIALVDTPNTTPALPHIVLPGETTAAIARLQKIQPQRLIALGLAGDYAPLVKSVACPRYWINAHDAAAAEAGCQVLTTSHAGLALTGAVVTGDPLAGLDSLPPITADAELCLRFKEQRESGRWLGYFAATGENEEDLAYALFSRAMRHKMGLMLLAPRDPERCEPVYRESIKYRLQTIRHQRFSTSFVPIKTRVYYIEQEHPLAAFYGCVDFVVAGATLHADARNVPDILSPILHGKPVLVGAAHRDQPLIAAAIEAGVVLAGIDNEQLFTHIKALLDDPDYGSKVASQASDWLNLQVGSSARVLALLN